MRQRVSLVGTLGDLTPKHDSGSSSATLESSRSSINSAENLWLSVSLVSMRAQHR